MVPSLFNINEPLVYGTIVCNPFMFIPMIGCSIIHAANVYLWMSMGWAAIPFVNFDMNNLPNAISAYIQSAGCWGNVVLVFVNMAISALLYYPFFKAADKHEVEKEAERIKLKEEKRKAKELEKMKATAIEVEAA